MTTYADDVAAIRDALGAPSQTHMDADRRLASYRAQNHGSIKLTPPQRRRAAHKLRRHRRENGVLALVGGQWHWLHRDTGDEVESVPVGVL